MHQSHIEELKTHKPGSLGASAKRKIVIEICSALLIILFVYAGLTKLLTYDKFQWDLLGHALLAKHSDVIAWLVPSIEIVIAFALLFKRTRLIGLYSSLIMLIMFTGYLVYMFNFYPTIPCSCGGVISKMTWGQHVTFNIFFTIAAGLGIWLIRKEKRISKASFSPSKY